MRPSGRAADELRSVSITTGVMKNADGSCLIKCGDTHVLCSATVETRLPPWLRNAGHGWITAEYGMLPCATDTRSQREAAKGRQSGRTQEIQRLIGRSLRAACDLTALGEVQIRIDCDVIQADGGTRTAAITGAWVAARQATVAMKKLSLIKTLPLRVPLAAVSCGIYKGTPVLDLDYAEDSQADTDANFVLNSEGGLIEIQGTAEKTPFSEAQLLDLLQLAKKGCEALFAAQKTALEI